MSLTSSHTARLDDVKVYYGEVLKNSDSLATNACTTAGRPPPHIIAALNKVDPNVIATYYGCGLVVPPCLDGLNVVDLGSGSGRDCFVLSQFCGEKGHVVGIDMTATQLTHAHNGKTHHATESAKSEKPFSKVDFVEGYIEKLTAYLPPNMTGNVDLIVSNCVVNLSPDKHAVLKECYDSLKVGGEMYFSDVYSSRRMPQAMKDDKTLWGECISGALYWNDFINLAKSVGFLDPRLVEDSVITINNPILEEKCGEIKFFSATYRLLKLPELESHCEDYGQAVIYKGTVKYQENAFVLDSHHRIEKGKVFGVCGNTWRMLHDTRFKDHFTFIGDFSEHFGIYDGCGTTLPFASAVTGEAGGCGPGGCC